MEKVYHSKDIDKIIERIDFSRLGKNVAIKLHFGEKGCVTYLRPIIAKKIYDKLTSLGKKATLIECNVLYRGARTNSTDHIRTAKEHGFDFAPIDILDGEKGDQFVEVKLDSNSAKIGKGIKKYDSMIVLSHFKGHMFAGYGGAIKNMGMGLGSRAGKLAMHSNVKPKINSILCEACGDCIKNCNANAITIEKTLGIKRAKIDSEKCEGCAMCIAVCPKGAVSIPWGSSTSSELQERMAGYAGAVMKIIPKEKMVFINVLENITSECDCMGKKQKPIIPDIGILVSNDIVSIETASLDLFEKHSNGKFGMINFGNNRKQVDFAFEKGLGNREYELVGL